MRISSLPSTTTLAVVWNCRKHQRYIMLYYVLDILPRFTSLPSKDLIRNAKMTYSTTTVRPASLYVCTVYSPDSATLAYSVVELLTTGDFFAFLSRKLPTTLYSFPVSLIHSFAMHERKRLAFSISEISSRNGLAKRKLASPPPVLSSTKVRLLKCLRMTSTLLQFSAARPSNLNRPWSSLKRRNWINFFVAENWAISSWFRRNVTKVHVVKKT